MKTLHAAHLGALVVGIALASPTVFAGDDWDRYSDKGGAVTHAQWAHGTAEKNFGVVRQVKQAEDLGIIPTSLPIGGLGASTGADEGE
ncbi:hypothetical protein [Thiococcus pfennigii]|uniref:hypothetical protein n=1 Tax=Thiococcus pfennigii TaxID=1057 RepID=UPI0019073807|nr:hypothetical protein [Thiococcus pfennigii]MBK1731648.1 hypothetical protein [Thiococcus pfennigii]